MIRKLMERRALESGVTSPADWLIDIFGGRPTYSGEKVTTETAMLNSNVYTCASILGGDIGKLPMQVFKRKGEGIQKDMTHPAAYLLSIRPNPYMSAYIWKETMQVHMTVWGNAYSNIEWDEWGYPKALWPLDPSKTTPIVDNKTGEVWYITTLPSGEQRKLPHTDVLHFRLLSKTGLKGITPIEVIREEIGVQQASKKFIGAFYANGTTTRGALKTPSTLDPDSKDMVREEWQKLNSGLTNAHRIAVLDQGMDYINLGMPLQDAQFIETAKFGILEVGKIYKIPPHKLGQMDRATFANIEHQSLEYVKNTLQPIIVNWEQELNFKLFTGLEQKRFYIKFNLASELRGDAKSRADFYKTMMEMGAYTINEVRALEELDNIGELGDKHFISLNYVSLELMDNYQMAKARGKGGENGDGGKGNKTAKD